MMVARNRPKGILMRLLLCVALCVVVAGCGALVRSQYTPYHSLNSKTSGKTVAVVPGNDGLEGSLQFESFKTKLEYKLQSAGFTISRDPANADLLAYFTYGIDDGKTTVHTGSTPIYGQTGGGTAYHSGTVSTYGTGGYGTGSYSGSSYTMPTYGIVGSQSYSYDVTTYTRVLALDLLDRKELDDGRIKKVYEVKLTSKGSCGQIAGVFDAMLTALFTEFPGSSGKPRSIEVEWDSC